MVSKVWNRKTVECIYGYSEICIVNQRHFVSVGTRVRCEDLSCS